MPRLPRHDVSEASRSRAQIHGLPTARAVALQALIQLDSVASAGPLTPRTARPPSPPRADEILDDLLRARRLDPKDRGLAWELVYGVLRFRLSLDWRLDRVSDRPVRRLPANVRNALRLGAYQLLSLTRVPASAAVNESVQLIKRAPRAGRDWSGYVNAVLRSLVREPEVELPSVSETDPAGSLSVRYSCPAWLCRRWVARLGLERAEQLCRQSVETPPLTLRTNLLRTDRRALEQALKDAGYGVRPTRVSPVGLVLEKGTAVGAVSGLPQFRDGSFYIEDEAAQLVPLILDPQPGERVLDACAAPGGKATHLAARMENHGEVVAADQSASRLRLLEENCRRLGATIIRPVVADVSRDPAGGLPASLDRFDRVLVDAPCSGLGVLRRHPEGKWSRQEAALALHQAAQLNILKMAAKRLRPGGVLVYSTCSTEPEENELVVEEFCRLQPEFRREPVDPYLPAHARDLVTAQGDLSTAVNVESMDGFFAARLRRMPSQVAT